MIDIIRAMIVDYMARNNRTPDYIIIGEYILEELMHTPHTIYDCSPRNKPVTIFGIRIAESKDRYTLNLL